MCYRCTMLHDIRPMGTANRRESINLIFHSKIILPKVSFLYFFFSPRSWRAKPPHRLTPHIWNSLWKWVCLLHISMICNKRERYSPALCCFFCLCGEDKDYRNCKVWCLVKMRSERSYLIAIVNLLSTHSTHANRMYWVEEISLQSHTQDQWVHQTLAFASPQPLLAPGCY